MTVEKIDEILRAVTYAFSEFKNKYEAGKTSGELFYPFLDALKEKLGDYEILYDYIWGKDSLNIDGVTDKSYIPKNGDTVIMDISVGKDNQWCDICRTFFAGSVTKEQEHAFALIKKSISAGEKYLKSNSKAEDVYKAMNSVFEKENKSLVHHGGHQIGQKALMEPRFVLGESEKIKSSHFYTIESGLYNDFGIRLENDYYIDGENLNNLFEKYMNLDIKEYILI